MTREEAIHIVDVAFGVPQAVRRAGEDRTYHEDEIREAKEMAMAALKAEPCDSLKLDGMLEDAYEHGYEQARHDFEVQPCKDAISRKHLLSEIGKLMQSPWFNNGKDDDMFTHYGYVERKEAVEIVRDMCVKAEPPVIPKSLDTVLDEISAEINTPNRGTCDYFIVDRIEEIIDKYKAETEDKE